MVIIPVEETSSKNQIDLSTVTKLVSLKARTKIQVSQSIKLKFVFTTFSGSSKIFLG